MAFAQDSAQFHFRDGIEIPGHGMFVGGGSQGEFQRLDLPKVAPESMQQSRRKGVAAADAIDDLAQSQRGGMRLTCPRVEARGKLDGSAFCAAALLSDGDERWAPVYYGLALVVAWSRVHVNIHHASDVVAGMAIGALLGEVSTRIVELPRPAPPSAGI